MSKDDAPTAISGLGWGLYVGLFPAALLGLGHGLFSWNSSNILPTAFMVDAICGGIGLVGAWLFGVWDNNYERKKKEEELQEQVRKEEKASAEVRAHAMEFNKTRTLSGFTIDEVADSMIALFKKRKALTDFQWGTEVTAWMNKYNGRRVVGEGVVENVRGVEHDSFARDNGYQIQIVLRDKQGRLFNYALGPNEQGLAGISRGSPLKVDGKLQPGFPYRLPEPGEAAMFLLLGWK